MLSQVSVAYSDQVSFQISPFIFFSQMTSSRIAGSYGSPILIFLGTSILFFILTAPNYSPSDSAQRFHFSTALLTPVISSLCDNNYYNSCEMISNCFFLNWGTVSLQYFVSFCCTTKLITSLSFCLSLSTHTHTHTHTRPLLFGPHSNHLHPTNF